MLPIVVAVLFLIGLTIAIVVPGLARRIGEGLAREEGIEVAGGHKRDRR